MLQVNIIVAILFVIACIFLVTMGTIAAPTDTLIGLGILSTGLPVYFIAVRPVTKLKWMNAVSGR